ncbi:hypothetical protein [Thermodesulfovibrio sp. TK110]
MEIPDIIKHFRRFREKDIKFFIKNKIIEFPLTEEDFIKLSAIHSVWRRESFIKLQLSGYKKTTIKKIVEQSRVNCNNKLSSWLYTRLKEAKDANKKIHAKTLIREAIRRFNLNNTYFVKKNIALEIKRIRIQLRKQFSKCDKSGACI